ncbi:MAG: hypothetical protein HZA49_08155 [Planctomycetes bacterium]|nr:hypothetical protein [Planctomycetota bacterium]
MKKISLICFSIVIMLFINYGCFSTAAITSRLVSEESKKDGTHICAGFGGLGADIISGYSLAWDSDENWGRNIYQEAPVAIGFTLIDALIAITIDELFPEQQYALPPKKEASEQDIILPPKTRR